MQHHDQWHGGALQVEHGKAMDVLEARIGCKI